MINRSTSTRLLYTVFVTQSLLSAAQIAVFTLMAIVATRLSGTENLAGLPSSTLTFSQAFAALPAALIMGRFGRRLGLTLGYTASMAGGVVGVIAILTNQFVLLLLCAVLLGIGRASGDQSRYIAGDLFPEAERARMIGRLVFAGTIGAVAGPVLVAPSSRLMESLGLHADTGPWVVVAVVCGIAALVTFFLLRPDPMQIARIMADSSDAKRKRAEEAPARPLSALLMLPKVQLATAALLVSQTVMVVLMVMTPLHMDHHQHGREAISGVISLHTLGMFGLSPLTGWLIDRFGRIPMLMAGALTLAASALLAPVSNNEYILGVALFLLGLGWNFGYVSGSTLLADALQGAERSRVQGLNDALVFFAAGIGSLVAGPLFKAADYGGVSAAGLALVLALLAFILWFSRMQQVRIRAPRAT